MRFIAVGGYDFVLSSVRCLTPVRPHRIPIKGSGDSIVYGFTVYLDGAAVVVEGTQEDCLEYRSALLLAWVSFWDQNMAYPEVGNGT